MRRAAHRAIDEDFVPLFLADADGEPDPSEYTAPLRNSRRASISARILAAVCAAAVVAVVFAMFSSDAMREFIDAKASMAGLVPAPSAAAQPVAPPAAPASIKDPARWPSAPNKLASAPNANVTVANAAPTREEMRNAYQNALQPRTPATATAAPVTATPATATAVVATATAATATVAEPAPPVQTAHRLDPNEVIASRKRADALIASGDLAAARLVLRRAADDGDAQAAMTLAGTYDPAVLDKLGVHGFVPDIAMARDWYEKARRFGAAEAVQRLEVLASGR